MPYLTPDSIPEGEICRPLSIPASTAWLALVSGALTELTKPYNWQQFGSLTVEETVAKMQEIIDAYYATACAMCLIPGGYRVIRITNTGQLEQLDENGDWTPATDEYALPAPDARTGGTEADQICLAAKNAVNVLSQLYESLAESWDENLSEAEALTALIAAIIAILGAPFAPITAAIAAFFLAVFHLLYGALEYLGADLWTEDFSNQMTCFLVDCATNDAGVVTFDWDCFTGKLNSLADSFMLSEIQVRLYLQVSFILYFIGGVDGLNLAGATTEITNDDCSFCGNCDDYTDPLIDTLGAQTEIGDSDSENIYVLPTLPGTTGEYQSTGGVNTGEGYIKTVDIGSSHRAVVVVTLPDVCTFDGGSCGWYHSAFGVSTNFIALYDSAGNFLDYSQSDNINAVDEWATLDWLGTSVAGVKFIQFFVDVTDDTYGGIGRITVNVS